MDEVIQHLWRPIEDLPANWEELSDPQTAALAGAWKAQHDEIREGGSLAAFLERLKRKWAVETGAIEEVYSISEGATKTLIELGLDAALISHDDVDGSPESVVLKIKDQLQAVNGLYQFVASERPLGASYIKELHQVLAAHQDSYDAIDSLGQSVKRPLATGEWKKLPNNVEREGGYLFEFCPPEQVQSEMDALLDMYGRHRSLGVPPDVQAAWLHHRFTLIHPFVDGNGRIARCLATLVFLKAEWLPLVVTRHDKPAYILALRSADAGDLRPLVELFGQLQRKLIREALSIGREVVQEDHRWRGVLESLRQRFAQRADTLEDLLQRAHKTCDSLQIAAQTRLEAAATELKQVLHVADSSFNAHASGASSDSDRAHYNYYQTVQCAKQLGYFANFASYRSWAALSVQTEARSELLFAFHAIGRGKTTVFGCAVMLYSRRSDEEGQGVIGDIHPIAAEPFEFTAGEDPLNVQKRFQDWLEKEVVVGLARWSESVE